jgi:hypothetical protein
MKAGCRLPEGVENNDLFLPHGLLYEFGDPKPSFLLPPEPAFYPFLAVQVEGEEVNVTAVRGLTPPLLSSVSKVCRKA